MLRGVWSHLCCCYGFCSLQTTPSYGELNHSFPVPAASVLKGAGKMLFRRGILLVLRPLNRAASSGRWLSPSAFGASSGFWGWNSTSTEYGLFFQLLDMSAYREMYFALIDWAYQQTLISLFNDQPLTVITVFSSMHCHTGFFSGNGWFSFWNECRYSLSKGPWTTLIGNEPVWCSFNIYYYFWNVSPAWFKIIQRYRLILYRSSFFNLCGPDWHVCYTSTTIIIN